MAQVLKRPQRYSPYFVNHMSGLKNACGGNMYNGEKFAKKTQLAYNYIFPGFRFKFRSFKDVKDTFLRLANLVEAASSTLLQVTHVIHKVRRALLRPFRDLCHSNGKVLSVRQQIPLDASPGRGRPHHLDWYDGGCVWLQDGRKLLYTHHFNSLVFTLYIVFSDAITSISTSAKSQSLQRAPRTALPGFRVTH
eukprot:365887-Chlamydomonas_euryale.AAC.6